MFWIAVEGIESIMAGKSWQSDQEEDGHSASTVRKQGESRNETRP